MMKNNFLLKSILGVLVLQLFAWPLNAQTIDTLVVYETIYITDTVFIEPEMPRDTIQMGMLRFVENQIVAGGELNEKLSLELKGATIPKNCIYTSEHSQQKSQEMRKLTLLGLTFLALNTSTMAQNERSKTFSVYTTENLFYQIFYYPELETILKDSPSRNYWDLSKKKSSAGIGISFDLPVNGSSLSFIFRLNYIRKPSAFINGEKGKVGDLVCTYTASKNKFNYLNLDLLCNYYGNTTKKISLYSYGGFRLGILTGVSGSLNVNPYLICKDVNIPYFNYHKTNLGVILGGGASLGKHFYFEIEANKDLNHFVKNNELRVSYFSFNFNLGYKLFQIAH